MKVFVTGGTGFIGSYLIRVLLGAGHNVIALRREKSSLIRCTDFEELVEWVNQDHTDWNQTIVAAKPAVIIHAAWAGVTAAERADLKLQVTNLNLFADLLQIADDVKLLQFIALGSQAEYGKINGRVDENYPCQPDTAYGICKLAALTLLEGYSRKSKLSYIWLRLFSVYGPGEGETWFIPNLIRQMRIGQSPQLSGCDQCYDYLHVQDLADAVMSVLQHDHVSGVFNLSSNASFPLKKVVELVREYTCCKVDPKFGELPYREGQSMHMEGDSNKFNRAFSFYPKISIDRGLKELIHNSNQLK